MNIAHAAAGAPCPSPATPLSFSAGSLFSRGDLPRLLVGANPVCAQPALRRVSYIHRPPPPGQCQGQLVMGSSAETQPRRDGEREPPRSVSVGCRRELQPSPLTLRRTKPRLQRCAAQARLSMLPAGAGPSSQLPPGSGTRAKRLRLGNPGSGRRRSQKARLRSHVLPHVAPKRLLRGAPPPDPALRLCPGLLPSPPAPTSGAHSVPTWGAARASAQG